MQKNAITAGRNFLGKLQTGYHIGRHIAHAVDRTYGHLKKLHGAVAPALMDSAPGLARAASKAMGSYEATRSAVQNADAIGHKLAGAVNFRL